MLPDVDELVAADVGVLMFFDEHRWRIAVPPSVVALNTALSQSHANRRCQELEDLGMLQIADERGYYQITDLGARYLDGEASAEEISKSED